MDTRPCWTLFFAVISLHILTEHLLCTYLSVLARGQGSRKLPRPPHFSSREEDRLKLNTFPLASDLGLALSGKKTRGRQGVNFGGGEEGGLRRRLLGRGRWSPRAQGAACLYKVGAVVSSGAAGSWSLLRLGRGDGVRVPEPQWAEMVGGRRERVGSEVGEEGVGNVRGG